MTSWALSAGRHCGIEAGFLKSTVGSEDAFIITLNLTLRYEIGFPLMKCGGSREVLNIVVKSLKHLRNSNLFLRLKI